MLLKMLQIELGRSSFFRLSSELIMQMLRQVSDYSALFLTWLSLGLGCEPSLGAASTLTSLCRETIENYSDIAFASYSRATESARNLQGALEQFTANPTRENLSKAKNAWRDSRPSYLRTEAFRFYAGPIDDENGLEPLINGWPIDEFYIDYVEGAPESGIIHDEKTYPVITPELLERQNERAGETAITCGFHAIEFLLWGQDLSATGPGNRPLSDFTQSPQAERRKAYLLACGELLVKHLEQVARAWNPRNAGNYRASFQTQDPLRSFWFSLYGLQTFAGKELAGERLLVAWDTRAQEDEHSCFSDNTLADLHSDLQGIYNLYHGVFPGKTNATLTGPGMKTVFDQISAKDSAQLGDLIKESIRLAKAIPEPFDQAILGNDSSPGRSAILACVESLEDMALVLSKLEQQLLVKMRQRSTE